MIPARQFAHSVSVCVFLFAANAIAASVDFGQVPLGQNKTMTVTLTFTKSETLGSIAIRTQGRDNADFVSAGKSNCKLNEPYEAHSTCTAKIAFQPQRAGMRLGAVVLSDGKGSPIATTYLHGIGLGAERIPRSDAKTTIGGLSQPSGIAVDDRGSIYVVTSTNIASGITEELPQPNGSFSPVQLITAAYPQRAIAIDDSRNIFVAGDGVSISKETPGANGAFTETAIGGRIGVQCGVAIDGAGNVYTSDCKFNVIYKETLNANGSYTQSIVAAGLREPAGLAVDGDGVLFVASVRDQRVYKETPSGDSYKESSISGPFSAPQDLALDAGGNLYVADKGSRTVYKEAPTPFGTYIQSTIVSDVGANGIAIDSDGLLYVSDLDKGKVLRLPLPQ